MADSTQRRKARKSAARSTLAVARTAAGPQAQPAAVRLAVPALAPATLNRATTSRATPSRATPSRATTSRATTSRATTSPIEGRPDQLNGARPAPLRQDGVNGRPYRPAEREPDVWDERVAGLLRFLRRRITGEYRVDEFGFDPELTDTLIHPVLRLLYQRYFRVETTGVQHLPAGGALIVANHSGTLPLDSLMLSLAVHDETPGHRHLRLLAADLVFRVPFLSEAARKSGATLACNPDAERLLHSGEYVGVFPEGFKGIGKPYRERYKLQRFGRGGFVSAALRTGVPIVPAAIIGAEEIYPIIANARPLARVLGLPYLPVTPLFPWLGPAGLLPLPSKWLIEFSEPIETAGYAGDPDDPITVFDLADQVRETIQQTLHTLLERRPDPFG